jgi:hypothetical protein
MTLLETFLGLHMEYLVDGSVLFTQPRRIQELVDEYKIDKSKYPSVPMSSQFNDADQNNSPRREGLKFMTLLGKLIFIVKTRPDIAFAVNRLATRSSVWRMKDYWCLLRIVGYLGGSKELGIRLGKDAVDDRATATQLFCYVDAAYASHPDLKSHTGYCFALGDQSNGMFYSRSFQQPNTTLSSTEEEHSAAVEATKEIIWFRGLLGELGYPQLHPTPILADSASMITLASEHRDNHARVKHYLLRINFLIEQVKAGRIALCSV